MNIAHIIPTHFAAALLLLLNSACSSDTQAIKQPAAPSKNLPSTTKTLNHPNTHNKANNIFIVTPTPTLSTPSDIKTSPFSKNLDRILNTKSEKNVKVSGDVYLNDNEEVLGAAPLLNKIDGGAIDVEVKFK